MASSSSIVGTVILGVVLMYVWMAFRPAFFRGEILNRDTPTRVPEDIGVPVGLFGIEPFADADKATPRYEPTGSAEPSAEPESAARFH